MTPVVGEAQMVVSIAFTPADAPPVRYMLL